MRKLFPLFIALFLISLKISSQDVNSYNIEVTVTGNENSFLSLAYHLGDKQYIKDTCMTDATGMGSFTGQLSLDHGLYLIVLPDNRYFEVIISDDQEFAVSCNSNDMLNSLRFTGSQENEAFLEYQKSWADMQGKAGLLRERAKQNSNNNDSLRILTEMISTREKEMIAYLKEVRAANTGTLLSALVGALLPVEMVDFDIPFDAENADSIRWVMSYQYNKNHFFDNIDLTDSRLIRTPLLYNKINTYFNDVILQVPDTVNHEIDRIISMCESNSEVFRFVIVYLFNHYRQSQIMGQDAIMVKLADDYYLSGQADWVDDDFKENLKKDIDKLRFNLIGRKAMDLTMDTYEGVFRSVNDIKKDFIILYFWEPDCGHCKEATPILKEYYDMHRDESIEIFAVCTQNDRESWEKYIAENGLEWINGWDPYRDTHFDFYYNVTSTPMIYILNKDKIIIAKKLPVESIGDFMDNYRQYGH